MDTPNERNDAPYLRALGADLKRVQAQRDEKIARAAQVQILRELADEWATDEIGTSSDTVERETWWAAIGELRATADELEQP